MTAHRASRRITAQASPLATRKAIEPSASGRQTRSCRQVAREVMPQRIAGAPVEPQGAGQLHGAGRPAHIAWGPHPEVPIPTAGCQPVDGLPVLEEARPTVKNTDPMKKVTAVAIRPHACDKQEPLRARTASSRR